MRITQIVILAATLVFSAGASSGVLGQPGIGTSGSSKPKPKPIGPGKVIYVPKTEIRVVTRTTGSLSVAADSTANLLVEPLTNKRAEGQEGTVPAAERIFIFNDLKPGRYRVAGALVGHHPSEKEILIQANKSQSLTLVFQPIVFSLTINTNVSTGELKYGPEGQPLTNVASVLKGKVQLTLPQGKYTVEVRPGEFGYETRSETFSLDKDQILDMTLKRIVLSTDTLSPTWTKAGLQEWEMPAGWQDSKRNLLVKGPGVALPREQGYRFYKDFRLVSTVKMSNGVAISFVLRARDSNNYYLLQLTGANSDDPHMLRLYILKGGVERRIKAIPIAPSAARPMDAGQFFNVSIKMVGYEIEVEIVNSQTGAPYTLGVLNDPDHNFDVGAVGVAARNQEENVIGRFVVCPVDKCIE
ncbi:MAG: hypothetical protein ACR2HX_19870 [Pyrinomonadaceae bacterium]